MVAPNYAAQRRELAVKIGLGRPRKAARGARQSTARPKTAKRSGADARS
jgi:predicted transcriptional regulator